jgi:hypothetical protein
MFQTKPSPPSFWYGKLAKQSVLPYTLRNWTRPRFCVIRIQGSTHDHATALVHSEVNGNTGTVARWVDNSLVLRIPVSGTLEPIISFSVAEEGLHTQAALRLIPMRLVSQAAP